MDANQIAHQVAIDLTPDYGPELVEKTDETFERKPQPTRGIIDYMHVAVDVGHIAHFLYVVTPIMMARWAATRDKDDAVTAGEQVSEQKKLLKPDIAKRIVAAIARRLDRVQ